MAEQRHSTSTRGIPDAQASFIRNSALLSFAVLLIFVYTIDSWLKAQLMFIAFLVLFVTALPIFLRGRVSPAEPIALLMPLLLLGVCIKLGAIVAYGFDHLTVIELLNGKDPSILLKGAFAMMLGIVSYVFGYLATNNGFRFRLPRLISAESWRPGRVRTALLILMTVSGLATLLMLQRFGITSLGSLSAKRFNDIEGGSQSRFSTLNYWLFRLSLLGRFALYLWIPFADRLNRGPRWGGYMVLLAIAAIPPVIVSNRAGLALIMADVLLIRYFILGRIRVRSLVLSLGAAFVAGLGLLASRSGKTSVSDLAEGTVLGRDFLDVTKTSHIVSFIEPGTVAGESYYGWPFVLVPDSVWADKPLFARLGRFVWQEGYDGLGINGVPAGMVGEAWMSFGWVGILLVPAIVGMLLRKFYLTLRPHFMYSNAVIIYSMVVIRFGVFTWSNDIGTGILKTALDVVPMLVLLRFVSSSTRRGAESRPQSALSSARSRS